MIVSNTEISTYNICKRRHHYQSILKLEPSLLPVPLYRGIVGHMGWEAYYISGRDVNAAKNIFRLELAELAVNYPEETKHFEALSQLMILIEKYHEFYGEDEFEVLEIEKSYRAPISLEEDLWFGLRLDLLGRFTRGPYRGDLVIVDHKFVYNLKTKEDIEVDGQMPKYTKTLQANGLTITKWLFNQIRYRSLKDPDPSKIFKRELVKDSPEETEQIWKEQKEAALEIRDNQENPNYSPRRSLHPIVCKGCQFQKLCKAELRGHNTNTMMRLEYKPSTYVGYSMLEES